MGRTKKAVKLNPQVMEEQTLDGIVINEIVITKKLYELKGLRAVDLFKISRFLKFLGMEKILAILNLPDISNALNGLLTGTNTLTDVSRLFLSAIDLILDILCSEAETEIYKFLSDMSDLSVKEVQDLPLDSFIQMIIDFVTQPTFLDFLKRTFPQFMTETAPQAE